MKPRHVALATALLLGLGTTTAHPREETGPSDAGRVVSIQALADMPDADAKSAAALLAADQPSQSSRTQPLLDRAATVAPAAPDLALLDITVCGGTTGCDAMTRQEQLEHRDPGNAAFLMVPLHEATVRGDQQRIDDLLARMAGKRRFDLYFARIGKRIVHALQRLPAFADGEGHAHASSAAVAASALAGSILPPFQDLVRACTPSLKRVTPKRRTRCRQIADRLEQGDTLIAYRIGLRLQELNAQNTTDQADAVHARCLSDWRYRQFVALARHQALSEEQQIALLWSHERESDAIKAGLEQAGKTLEPPPGWCDKSTIGGAPADPRLSPAP